MISALQDDRPVVIGGGIAGIAAAVELARSGAQPLLLESRPYLGGRVRSFVHSTTGDEIDNGQHLLMGCYHSTFRLLELLGTRHLVELQPSLHVEFRDPDGSATVLTTPAYLPSPLNVVAGMLRLRPFSLSERAALLRVGLHLRSGSIGNEETVRQFLDRLGQTRRVQERLWDPIVIATLNTAPAEASAELFAEVMRRAFFGSGMASRLGFARKGLSHLIEPALEYITSHGGSVMTGVPVQRIEKHGNGYQLQLKEHAPVQTTRIISALPSGMLRTVVAHDEELIRILDLAQPLTTSPIVSLYLWFDQPLDEVPPFCALLGTSVQWLFNRRRIAGDSNREYPGLLSCTISAAGIEARMESTEMIRLAEREIRAAVPEIGTAQLLEGIVIKEKQATFVASPSNETHRNGAATPLPGFYRAGDWTDTGLPATIEGAAQSGFAAASLLLNDSL